MKIKEYAIYTSDMEFPYAFALSTNDPQKGVLIAPVLLQHFGGPLAVSIPHFRKKAFIVLDRMQVIPVDRLIKRIWNLREETTTQVLQAIKHMVSVYKTEKEMMF